MNTTTESKFYYLLSIATDFQSAIIDSDDMSETIIDLGELEQYLRATNRIGVQHYIGFGDYDETEITLEDIFKESDEGEINDLITEWLNLSKAKDIEIPFPTFDQYQAVQGSQRPIYEEERYLKFVN